MVSDEIPPSWMWHLDGPLEDWFADVERAREERLNPNGVSNDDSSWVKNELAEGRR